VYAIYQENIVFWKSTLAVLCLFVQF
jgi:hypothetical protein